MLRGGYEGWAGLADPAGLPLQLRHGPRSAGGCAHDLPASPAAIATTHLRLRPFALTPIAQLVHRTEARIDPCTGRAAAGAPRRAAAADAHRGAWLSRHCLHWAVSRLLDERPLGYVSLHGIVPELGVAQLSFWAGCGSARVACASEAAQAVLAFAFSTLGMEHVYSCYLGRDRFGQQVLARIGMRAEEGSRGARREPGAQAAVLASGITRAAWLGSL